MATIVNCKWKENEECSEKFDSELECYLHVISTHAKTGKFNCKWQINNSACNALQRHRGILKDHAVSHFSYALKPFKCKLCGALFRTAMNCSFH